MKRIVAIIISLTLMGAVAFAETETTAETTQETTEIQLTAEADENISEEKAAEEKAEVSETQSDKYGEKYYVTDKDGEKRVRFTYDVENGKATITDVHVYKDNTDLVFPAEIDGYPVKAADNVILPGDERERIISLTFENGIERLHRVYIDYCPNIETIAFGDSIREISDSGFFQCTSLKKLHLPEKLERGKFNFGGSALTSVTIPDGMTEIPENFLNMCESLTDVTMGSGVKVIGKSAFAGCTALEDIAIPSSVTAIGDYAFSHCKGIKKITIPDRVSSIGVGAFYEAGIEKIKLPSGLTEIGEKAFYATPLEEINIPKSVKTIGKNAFAQCAELKKLTISDKTRVNASAFSGCKALDDVTVDGEMSRDLFEALNRGTPYIQKYSDNYDGDFVIFDGCLSKYKGTDKNPVIPEGVTELGEQAFQNTAIDSVTFPTTKIAEIPSYCFKGSQIKEITIPSTVGKVKEMAFYGCMYLEKLTIEDGVESVQDNAFINCYSLTEKNVNIGKKVRVSVNAFKQTPLDEEFTNNGGVSWRRGDDYVMEVPYKNAIRNSLKNAQSFKDMADSEESALMQRLGAISGYEDGTFRPQNDVTRAEVVKIILNVIGYSDEDIAEFGLDYASGSQEETIRECADYNPNHWANAYLQRGVDMGIISGFEDGTLRPDDNVTVEQLYTMLVNITGYGGYAKKDGYPEGYIKQAQTAGIDNDMGINEYSKNATRLEAMKAVYNAVNAPVCLVKNETRLWDGTLVPEYEIKNGTGRNFRSLLTYNFRIFPVEAEVTDTDDNAVTVNIYGAVSFGGRAIAARHGKSAVLKTDNGSDFVKGKNYKMYVKINDIDEEDYELVCAAAIE